MFLLGVIHTHNTFYWLFMCKY